MMDYMMIDSQILTVPQRDALRSSLEKLSKDIYTKKSLSPTDGMTSSMRDAIVLFLEKNKIDIKKTTDVREAFEKLAKHLDAYPTLTLELAFEPTAAQLQKIAGKLELYGIRPFLQIRVSNRMLAGAVFEMNGIRKDYSLTL